MKIQAMEQRRPAARKGKERNQEPESAQGRERTVEMKQKHRTNSNKNEGHTASPTVARALSDGSGV